MTSYLDSRQPRYLQLAENLINQIEEKSIAVGDLLPGEHQLCEQHNVSRYTVREAIRQLKHLGFIETRHGIGTEVISDRPTKLEGQFSASFHSIDELILFGISTELRIIHSSTITANSSLAKKLSCSVNDKFLVIEGLRTLRSGDGKPISWHRAYVPARFAGIADGAPGYHGGIYEEIERKYGVSIRKIHQVIVPMAVTDGVAKLLGVKKKSPALQIQRTYLTAKNEVVEHGFSVLAGKQANLEMDISYQKHQS